jgi:hypothetical protein
LKLPRFFAILFLTFTSLLFVPTMARADDIVIELTQEIPYIDTVVEVVATSEYVIETANGLRFETLADGTRAVRAGWVDSWIELRQGETILRADDDSNHVTGVNEYASKLTGTIDAGTYTIRATSYLNRVAGATPTGTYILFSNLIPPAPPAIIIDPVIPEEPPQPPIVIPDPPPLPEPIPVDPVTEPPVVNPIPEPSPEPVPEPAPEPQPEPLPEPLEPEPVPEPLPVEEEPPAPAEEPPVPVEEPPAPEPEPPVEEEVPAPQVPEPAPELPSEPPDIEPEPPAVATEDSTPEEREAIAETLIEEADGEPLTTEAIAEAGLTYDDLPPQTLVEIRQDENGNEVVITAEIAAALVVLANPAELVSAIFTDPAQALLAFASIGADMSTEERKESEKTIVAAVIVGGIATQSALTVAASAGTVSYRRKP